MAAQVKSVYIYIHTHTRTPLWGRARSNFAPFEILEIENILRLVKRCFGYLQNFVSIFFTCRCNMEYIYIFLSVDFNACYISLFLT